MVFSNFIGSRMWVFAAAATLVVSLSGCDYIKELVASISDGAACTQDGTCLGGVCLGAEEGFPGGYCTTTSCESRGCSNIFGAECLSVETLDDNACFMTCKANSECREGYACLSVDTRRICLPSEEGGRYPEAGAVGTACSFSAQCEGSSCMTTFVGGYCTILDCEADTCPGNSRCVTLSEDDEDDAGDDLTLCLRSCESSNDCRFGYRCDDPDGGGGVCVELPREQRDSIRNPGGLEDGASCTTGLNCMGGTCLRDVEGYPDGYCTTLDCAMVGCNSNNAVCRSTSEDTACFVGCSTASDCRSGYTCVLSEGSSGFCSPDLEAERPDDLAPSDGGGGDSIAGDLSVSCESSAISGGRSISFEVADDVIAFTIVPYVSSGQVRPTRLLDPSGSVVADFYGNYDFQNVNTEILRTIAPISFPAAPQFDGQITAGTWKLEVATSSSEVCWYPVRKTADGRALDVNFYLVGIPGLSASNAANHRSLSTALETMKRMYAGAAVNIREVRYLELSSADTERFRIIRSINDIFALAGKSTAPGSSRSERLSVNVFLIQGFAVPQSPGLLGLSLGIPGVPGSHGNTGAGLVFTSEYLDSDPSGIGQTLAHEIGHFVGLRHTSEHGGTSWDPLDDTPQCSDPERGSRCPDATNFMFPFSISGMSQEEVSAGQGFVIRRAALTQ